MKRTLLSLTVIGLLLTSCAAEPGVEPGLEPGQTAAPTGAAEAPLEPKDCVVGVWKVDNAMFARSVAKLGSIPAEFTIEGDLVLRLSDAGDYSEIKDEFTILTSREGTTVRSVTTGAMVGSYLVEGNALHFFDGIDVHHESYLDVPGIGRVTLATGQDAEVHLFDTTATVPTGAVFEAYNGAATFVCTPQKLELTVHGETSTWRPSTLPAMDGWRTK